MIFFSDDDDNTEEEVKKLNSELEELQKCLLNGAADLDLVMENKLTTKLWITPYGDFYTNLSVGAQDGPFWPAPQIKQTNKQTNHFEKTEKQRKLPQFTYQSSTDYIFA